MAQGNLPEALKLFRDGLAIADRLVKLDRSNAGWQSDLAEYYTKVGEVLVADGNRLEALKIFPRRAPDPRASSEGRWEQCGLAARPHCLLREHCQD